MSVEIPNEKIAALTGSASVVFRETIQSLWSGYGLIAKVDLVASSGDLTPAVVKYVSPPANQDHKYGWQGNVSHRRKLSSYQNEFLWYQNVAAACAAGCRVPKLIAGQQDSPNWLFVLEDLDHAGFPIRLGSVCDRELESCLSWLAHFHASFLYDSENDSAFSKVPEAQQLWPTGTYWHLETRPDEFDAMPDGPLKKAAHRIDQTLQGARFRTLVHGDAKLANFCFSQDGQVAAVDFQYVGGGCGMQDLAYFVSSCFDENECERREGEILERYFQLLKQAVKTNGGSVAWEAWDALEAEWRTMYVFAWADFYRFLTGWSPGHWKVHAYSQRMAALACDHLEG
jgi:hypothetical protein